jgi:hypothetical protein
MPRLIIRISQFAYNTAHSSDGDQWFQTIVITVSSDSDQAQHELSARRRTQLTAPARSTIRANLAVVNGGPARSRTRRGWPPSPVGTCAEVLVLLYRNSLV